MRLFQPSTMAKNRYNKSMGNWKQFLKANPTDWLLEEDNPSVRHFTLTDILGLPPNAPEVKQARDNIMQNGPVPVILSRQKESGYWDKAEDFYIRAKYRGTVWTLIILAELGADGTDKRVVKASEFILEHSQDPESGGFSYCSNTRGRGLHSGVLPCLTGNMVWSLLRFGQIDNPGVQFGVEWIVKYQRFDDAVDGPPCGWPYDKFKKCWGKHTCHMGAVKALKALSEIPSNRRTKDMTAVIETGAEYFLKHHVHKRSHNLQRLSKPSWVDFGFPLMANSDAIEVLGILTKLGYHDPRMQEAVDLVISKQNEQGRWDLETTYNGRFQVNIEQKGQASKWVTLNALRVLKGFYA